MDYPGPSHGYHQRPREPPRYQHHHPPGDYERPRGDRFVAAEAAGGPEEHRDHWQLDYQQQRRYHDDGGRAGRSGYYGNSYGGGWSQDSGDYRYDDRSRYPRQEGDADFGAARRSGFAGGGGGYQHHHYDRRPPAASSAVSGGYEPILCPAYNWTQPDCRDPGCKLLHVCRNWLGGECTRADCRLSHSLADEHNWPKFESWLGERELAEMGGPDRKSSTTNESLRSWLFDKLPKICPSSLVPRLVCNSPRCKDLHVCVNIVKSGQCRYRQHCASPYHSLFMPRNLDVLRRYYPSISAHVDPTRSIEEQAWLSDVLKNDMDKPAPAGFDEHHFKLRGLTIDTVQMCLDYGEGRGECRRPGCQDLHVCRAWLGGGCPEGKSCRWVHGFTEDVVQRLERLADGRRLDCQYNIRDNLKVVFPCTCCYYNTDRGCQRGASNCDYIHLCNNFLRGKDCQCSKNHDPTRGSVPQRLARKGVDSQEKDHRVLLRNVLYAELRVKQPCPVCSSGRHSRSPSCSRSPSRSRKRRHQRSRSHSRSRSPSNRSRSKKSPAPSSAASTSSRSSRSIQHRAAPPPLLSPPPPPPQPPLPSKYSSAAIKVAADADADPDGVANDSDDDDDVDGRSDSGNGRQRLRRGRPEKRARIRDRSSSSNGSDPSGGSGSRGGQRKRDSSDSGSAGGGGGRRVKREIKREFD